ncbi:MAG: methyltransferase domain-containing protein [Acidobacteriaceae bacterium]|nr:methyltransferase domain-containing protein [Acidobacteriaceae bacterium]
MFDNRFIEPEALDHLSPEEARPNLADLVRINRKFGGRSVLVKTLSRAVTSQDKAITILDVGAGSGDSALVIREFYPRAMVTSLDYNWTNLEKAPRPKLIANAFELPFRNETFDYVLCSSFLHHFADAEVIRLLGGFYGMAKRALAICDLERHIVPYLFLPATKTLFGWNDITVSDGVKSVRASFRANELRRLATAAGIRNPDVKVFRPAFRLSMVAKK